MGPFIRIIEAIVKAICRAWFEEKRRLRKAKVIGGGQEVSDANDDSIEAELDDAA